MGTATQSITNATQRAEFDSLLRQAKGRNRKRAEQLDLKLREVVNKALFEDPALAPQRPAMQAAIDVKVAAEITTKLKDWIDNGKRPADWPFRDIEVDD